MAKGDSWRGMQIKMMKEEEEGNGDNGGDIHTNNDYEGWKF